MSNIVVEGPGSRDIANILDIDFGNRPGKPAEIKLSQPPPRKFAVRRTGGGASKPAQRRVMAQSRPFGSPAAGRPDVNAILSDFADPNQAREDRFQELPSESDGASEGIEPPSDRDDDDDDDLDDGDCDVEEVEQGARESGEDAFKPSHGYATIDDEKADLLFKIQRYRKQGRFSSKQFNIFSDVRELRAELSRIRTDIDVEQSIRFQRKLLMGVVSAIEFGNKKFKLADIHLDGWSAHVQSEIDTYDDVFEELFYKYRSKTQLAPELRLLLMVGGSGLMYSMSQTMFKVAMPRIEETLRRNPELVNQMATAYANTSPTAIQDAPEAGGKPRPMRGPGIDIAGMMGGLPFPIPGGEAAGNILSPPISSRTADHAKPTTALKKQTLDEERLSDIISEDLESLRSFDSGGSKRAREQDTEDNSAKKKKVVIIK